MIVSGTGTRTASTYDASPTAAALLHIEYLGIAAPPTARLTASQAASPPLTASADGSGSTAGDSPIASYTFNFGDGSAPVTKTAPTATAQHTYAAAGTYTVTLIVTDTGGKNSTPATTSITVSPAPDLPPVAKLTVSQLGTPALTVSADGSGSTDTDATPIATYHFTFGDGSAVVNTTASTAQHTYAAAGTYTVTLTATDTGNNTSAPVSSTITVAASGTTSIAVYVGYYDTHHAVNPKTKPSPWQGSPGVVFIGKADDSSNNWDSACLRVDNLSSGPLSSVVVTADLGSSHFALWGTNTIPAGGKLIMAQTAFENFDGSDTNPAGCYGCDPKQCVTLRSPDVPVVHVSLSGTRADYLDTGQVLNTGGYDGAGCPYVGGPLPQTRYDESHPWQQIFSNSPLLIQPGGTPSSTSTPPSDDAAPQTLSMAPPSPNPARGDLTVRFTLPATGDAWVGIYDIAGRLERTCVDNTLRAGVYSFRIDLGGIRPGIYFVRLWTPQGTRRERIVITR
jgi:PKD repeat protein